MHSITHTDMRTWSLQSSQACYKYNSQPSQLVCVCVFVSFSVFVSACLNLRVCLCMKCIHVCVLYLITLILFQTSEYWSLMRQSIHHSSPLFSKCFVGFFEDSDFIPFSHNGNKDTCSQLDYVPNIVHNCTTLDTLFKWKSDEHQK